MAQQQGVVGDQDFNVPVTEVDQDVLDDEKKLAKYSKTKEFKRLKSFLEDRIKFYQTYLPDGRDVKTTLATEKDFGFYWKVANTVIGEFQGIISEYEQAREAVKDAAAKDAPE